MSNEQISLKDGSKGKGRVPRGTDRDPSTVNTTGQKRGGETQSPRAGPRAEYAHRSSSHHFNSSPSSICTDITAGLELGPSPIMSHRTRSRIRSFAAQITAGERSILRADQFGKHRKHGERRPRHTMQTARLMPKTTAPLRSSEKPEQHRGGGRPARAEQSERAPVGCRSLLTATPRQASHTVRTCREQAC